MRNDDIPPFSRLRRRKYLERWLPTIRRQRNSGILAFRKVIFAHISFFNYCFVFCFFANTVFQAQF